MGIFRSRRNEDVRKVADQLESLQSELSALRRDAKKLREGVATTAGVAADTAEAAFNGMGNWTIGNLGTMRDWSRGRPLTALLVTLGAGAVLGALFLRR